MQGEDVKEATARIKINRLLEAAGWRFFNDGKGPANIRLESNATIKQADLDALGNDFERTSKGFIDFLLLDERGFGGLVIHRCRGLPAGGHLHVRSDVLLRNAARGAQVEQRCLGLHVIAAPARAVAVASG